VNARRRGLLLPGAVVALGLVTLLGLGTWQIERKAWKEALVETLTQRLTAEPRPLPPPAQWAQMTAENSEFVRVRLPIEWPGGRDALVYTGSSALRDDVKSQGYFVFTPARVLGVGTVVVNRGFVGAMTYPPARGVQEIVGVLRWPEQPFWLVAAHDTEGAIWTVRDHRAMAGLRGWGAVAPFYVEMEAPEPPGGLPHPAALKVQLRNDHLQYAITWYALAAVLVVMFAVWWARRRQEVG